MQSLIYTFATVLVVAAVLGHPLPLRAQQPLAEFVEAARTGAALDVRETDLAVETERARLDEARARLLPSFTATAGYTRNEVEVAVEIPDGPSSTQRNVITPYDQVEARFTLTVPLLDVSAWSSYFGSEAAIDAASERARTRRIETSASVVTAYYALVAARAVRDSAARTLTASEENLAVVEGRAAAGLASELDRQRAISDVERARQTYAEAELQEALAVRSLYVLTLIEPSQDRVSLDDDLHEEEPLATWMSSASTMPSVRAAEHDVRAAELARDSAWQGLLPTIAASASERVTNAVGFGPPAIWSIGVNATWTLDFGRPAAIGTREREVSTAQVRRERALLESETAIYEAWHRVRSLLGRARAARAAQAANERAAEVARARYAAGTGTQLEVSQSERDLFAAEVARIQADADLTVARLALRLRSGREL